MKPQSKLESEKDKKLELKVETPESLKEEYDPANPTGDVVIKTDEGELEISDDNNVKCVIHKKLK